MLEACRTCLGLIEVDESPYYEIEVDDVQLSTESCRYKLLSIVPKMALDITPKSILCAECHGSLEALFEFKEKCLKTENIITQYFQTKPGINNINLKDVSDFNSNNVRIIKDDDVETSFEDEVELSGSIITNVMHEIDDFSSVEIARPKSAVPASSDDIDVIEDKTFKEEVELSETVVTNVKAKVDSSESVAVAKNTVNVVPTNKDDIDVNKDKTMEVSVEDDALKEEVELSETVVTNVKDEVDLTKIASVAKNTINVVPANKNDIDVNKDKTIEVSVEDDAFKEKVELSETVVTNVVAKKQKKVTNSNLSCEPCDKRFKYASLLKSHLKSHPGEKPYRCEICDRRYRTKSYVKVHMKIHTIEKPFRCEKCNDQLTKHLRSHKGLPPYVCVVCNKAYSSEWALGVHRRYCDTWPLKCAICSKGFKIKSGLISHLRTHTRESGRISAVKIHTVEKLEKPFRCEKCNNQLTKHLRSHKGLPPYVCVVCNKGYSSKWALGAHRRYCDTRPFKCAICSKGFKIKSALISHLRTHTRESGPISAKLAKRDSHCPVA